MTRPQGEDDDGYKHYRVLGLPRTATSEQIKQAYRSIARTLHPDKGGSSEAFAALQTAFEVLSNPKTRAVYDALAADVRFRPGVAAPYSQVHQAGDAPAPQPGVTEAVLLQQLLRTHAGSVLDPTQQLCVTCEVCRRPATKECWTCSMPICEFCTRRQHWKGDVPLHWPLVNSPGRMLEQLGRQELEAKRKEDAAAYKASLPGYRPQSEMMILRDFQDAIIDLLTSLSRHRAANTRATTTNDTTATQPPKTAPASNIVNSGRSSCSSITTNNQASSSVSNTVLGSTLPTTSSFALPPASTTSSSSNSIVSHLNSCSSTALASPGGGSSKAVGVPGSSPVNRCYKAWQAADEAVKLQLMGQYDIRLARFYLWAQTPGSVLLAVHFPTGGTSHPPKLDIEATPSGLKLQHRGFAPLLYRAWAKAVDAAGGINSWVSSDGQLVTLVVPKAVPGQQWDCCFKGDSYGARCLQSPYSLLQLPHEVQLELPLPFWVMPEEDLQVIIGDRSLHIAVDGLLKLQCTYWGDSSKHNDNKVVDIAASSWCMMQDSRSVGAATAAITCTASKTAVQAARPSQRPNKMLNITLALPELTQEEIQYKKGTRQNNAAASRSCPNGAGNKGYAFFVDDEDEFGLQSVLQALMFSETGRTWVGPKPWEVANGVATVSSTAEVAGMVVEKESALPAEVQRHLKWLKNAVQQDDDHYGTADV